MYFNTAGNGRIFGSINKMYDERNLCRITWGSFEVIRLNFFPRHNQHFRFQCRFLNLEVLCVQHLLHPPAALGTFVGGSRAPLKKFTKPSKKEQRWVIFREVLFIALSVTNELLVIVKDVVFVGITEKYGIPALENKQSTF